MPALDRGLDLLEQLALTEGPQSLSQIARSSGRTVSEVQRSILRLTRRGYLLRDERGHYRLSTKLFRLATAHPPFRDLVERSAQAMQDYADASGESVHLGVLSGDRLLIVSQVEGNGILRLSLRVGGTQDPLSAVSGRMMLAGLGERELSDFAARRNLTLAEAERLRHACEAIRKRGYEEAPNETLQGVHHLGVPVILGDGSTLAALTSSVLLPCYGDTALLDSLRPLQAAAQAIAAAYERAALGA